MNIIIKLSDGSYNYVPEENKTIYYNFSEEIFFLTYYIDNYKISTNEAKRCNMNKYIFQ